MIQEDRAAIQRLRMGGNCCAQIMVGMGLAALGEDNPRLMDAAAALCGGLQTERVCGALSGACCLLSMMDKQNAASDMIPELIGWFEAAYGGADCGAITGGRQNRLTVCPDLIEKTYFEAKQLLSEFGIEL